MMASTDITQSNEDFSKWPRATRAWLVGFAYWLAFLLALEPGNVFGSMEGLAVSHEMLRISAAALLGSSITPLVLASVNRFPVEGKSAWRNAAVQILGSLMVSAGLMVLSCIVANVLFTSQQRPFVFALRHEFEHNWLLVSFCILTFIGFCHIQFAQNLFGVVSRRDPSAAPPTETYVSSIPVKMRNELVYVQLGNVDWIEAQGNYLALHEGTATYLVRESLGNIEKKLDPNRFLRIHRGAIVSVNSVEGISSLGSGDAKLRLKHGAELRLSRKYRAAFVKAWRH